PGGSGAGRRRGALCSWWGWASRSRSSWLTAPGSRERARHEPAQPAREGAGHGLGETGRASLVGSAADLGGAGAALGVVRGGAALAPLARARDRGRVDGPERDGAAARSPRARRRLALAARPAGRRRGLRSRRARADRDARPPHVRARAACGGGRLG